MKKIYIIAGEHSGDLIGANIIRSLQSKEADIKIAGVGGNLMRKAGLDSFFDISQISKIGFVEILPRIFRIKKLINETIEDILRFEPDLLITIDSPGFTYRVAVKVKEVMNKVFLAHVVAPSVWAYKPGRAQKYANLYDHLFTILPFEAPYFTKLGIDVTYVGHPALDQEFYVRSDSLREEFCHKNNINNSCKIIAITPGSREQEIKSHLPTLIESLNQIQKKIPVDICAFFIQTDNRHKDMIETRLQSAAEFKYIFTTDRLKTFAIADLSIAKSGTNNIEIVASGSPLIVFYKLNVISFFIIKLMYKLNYINIINIIHNKKIIPEFVQSDFTRDKISAEALNLLLSKEASDKQVALTAKTLKLLRLEKKFSSEIIVQKIMDILKI